MSSQPADSNIVDSFYKAIRSSINSLESWSFISPINSNTCSNSGLTCSNLASSKIPNVGDFRHLWRWIGLPILVLTPGSGPPMGMAYKQERMEVFLFFLQDNPLVINTSIVARSDKRVGVRFLDKQGTSEYKHDLQLSLSMQIFRLAVQRNILTRVVNLLKSSNTWVDALQGIGEPGPHDVGTLFLLIFVRIGHSRNRVELFASRESVQHTFNEARENRGRRDQMPSKQTGICGRGFICNLHQSTTFTSESATSWGASGARVMLTAPLRNTALASAGALTHFCWVPSVGGLHK